jgi:hypothetical protein
MELESLVREFNMLGSVALAFSETAWAEFASLATPAWIAAAPCARAHGDPSINVAAKHTTPALLSALSRQIFE